MKDHGIPLQDNYGHLGKSVFIAKVSGIMPGSVHKRVRGKGSIRVEGKVTPEKEMLEKDLGNHGSRKKEKEKGPSKEAGKAMAMETSSVSIVVNKVIMPETAGSRGRCMGCKEMTTRAKMT